ncbi:hypothetical protein ACQ5SK_11335 [Bradyrhizobium japonicum]
MIDAGMEFPVSKADGRCGRVESMDAKLLIDVSLIIPPGAEIKAHSVRRVRANQQSITKLLMDAA